VQYELMGLLGQGSTGGPEEGGPAVVPAGVLQDAGQQQPVQLPAGLRVQLAGVGTESAGGAAQPLQRVRGDLVYLPAQLAAEAAQVVVHQQRQVVAELAQRRQVDVLNYSRKSGRAGGSLLTQFDIRQPGGGQCAGNRPRETSGRPGTGWPQLERELPQRLSRKKGRARGTLQRVVGFDGVRDVQSQVLELRA
jgi:hypothetical protein